MTHADPDPHQDRHYDVVILGAGGAGMMCAAEAGKRGRRVLMIDHAKKLGGKILISGGGRCNFTNVGASPAQYVSQNPHFVKSALSRYPAQEFIDLVRKHKIAYHEKKLGQLFCDFSAQQIVDLLTSECMDAGVETWLECRIQRVTHSAAMDVAAPSVGFEVLTSRGKITCESLVVATGGLSIPKIGATGMGYELAKQFGLALVERAPALDGLTWSASDATQWKDLAGISVDTEIQVMENGSENAKPVGPRFRENILFTHSGLSGPAALQASLHYTLGQSVQIDLLPGTDLFQIFLTRKHEGSRVLAKTLLAEFLSARLAEKLCDAYFPHPEPLPQLSEKAFEAFCHRLHHWTITPSGTVGYSKAEVTRGGVDTHEISSKTLEARKVPGLFFIGEVLDVTGWLGGYNFQWAWASGWAAGQVV